MDRFDEILKEKVEQFEVPFNEAHWAEMDGRLNKIRATKIKNTILGVAAGVVTLGIAGYFIFSSPTNHTRITDNNLSVQEGENPSKNSLNNEIIEPSESVVNSNLTEINNESIKDKKVSDNNVLTEEHQDEKSNTSNSNQEDLTAIERNIDQAALTEIVKDQSFEKITSDFIVYNNKVCLGEEVSFEAIETTAQVSYLWNFGDGKTSGKSSPTHVYKESMNFTVTLTLIDKRTGKEYTEIKHDAVEILPLPEVDFTYFEESKNHDDNKLSYPYTIFKVRNAENNSTYNWNFGNGQITESIEAKTIYQNADNYVVTLIAQNEFGCSKSVQKRVSIKDGINLYAPTAFTPNQDGTNENFIPKALLEWEIPFEMTITDKSGRTIYKTSDKSEPWNGKMNNNGSLANEGIYFWQVIIKDAYGNSQSYQGNIKLMK